MKAALQWLVQLKLVAWLISVYAVVFQIYGTVRIWGKYVYRTSATARIMAALLFYGSFWLINFLIAYSGPAKEPRQVVHSMFNYFLIAIPVTLIVSKICQYLTLSLCNLGIVEYPDDVDVKAYGGLSVPFALLSIGGCLLSLLFFGAPDFVPLLVLFDVPEFIINNIDHGILYFFIVLLGGILFALMLTVLLQPLALIVFWPHQITPATINKSQLPGASETSDKALLDAGLSDER